MFVRFTSYRRTKFAQHSLGFAQQSLWVRGRVASVRVALQIACQCSSGHSFLNEPAKGRSHAGSLDVSPRLLTSTVLATLLIAAVLVVAVPVSASPGDLSMFAGNLKSGVWQASGTADKVALNSPHGIAYDRNGSPDPWAGYTFISDTGFCSVRAVSPSGNLTTIVNANGKHTKNFCGPPTAGPAAASLVNAPHGEAYDHVHQQLYIADTGNSDVIDVDLTTSTPSLSICQKVLTTSQPLLAPVAVSVHGTTGDLYVADSAADIVGHYTYPCTGSAPDVIAGVYGTPGFNGDAQPCTSATLAAPDGVDYDSITGQVLISDTGNDEIRSCTGGMITHLLGTPTSAGLTPDGTYPGGSIAISAPHGCKVDGSGALFYDEVGNNLVTTIRPHEWHALDGCWRRVESATHQAQWVPRAGKQRQAARSPRYFVYHRIVDDS